MERAKPALVKAIEKGVKTVVAAGMHSLALTVDGVVLSFGCNDDGALGRAIDDDEEGFTPGEVELPAKIVQISAGDSHSAALDENGKAYYWGTFRDSSGAFGLTADGAMQKLPVPLAHHLDIAKISSGTFKIHPQSQAFFVRTFASELLNSDKLSFSAFNLSILKSLFSI